MSILRQTIQPGLCPIDPETRLPQCPPADRIECIMVDKVYDSCFQIDNRNQTITIAAGDLGTGSVGSLVNCSLDTATGITCVESGPRVSVGNGYFRVTLIITVPIILTNPTDTTVPPLTVASSFVFAKQVILCAPEGVDVICDESTVIGCNCVVTALPVEEVRQLGAITCDIQVCVVIKSIFSVQLLVPSYGYCLPQQCAPINTCPPVPPAQCLGEPIQTINCGCCGTTS